MKTLRLLYLFLKKKIKTAKLRSLIISLICSALYVFLFIILSSDFTIKKTVSKTFNSNVSNEKIVMSYSSGINNLEPSKYLELRNCFKKLDNNIFMIYLKTKYFELYDFEYFNISTNIKLNICEYTDCVIYLDSILK